MTGGTSGIGRAIALLLGQEGARVHVAGRDAERGLAVAREVTARGGEGRFVPVDVAVDADVARLARTAAADGPIDHWFSNAGVEGPIGPVTGWDEAALREVLDVNLKAVLSGLRHASEHMGAGGTVVNTASFVGTALPVPIAVPYAAAKAGVVAAGRSAAPAARRGRHQRVHAVPVGRRHPDGGPAHGWRTGRQGGLRGGVRPQREAHERRRRRRGGARPARRPPFRQQR
ncbi:MAG: SDR family NAD(P)-dependent oxidoreductase [Quadrisphaera sp.]